MAHQLGQDLERENGTIKSKTRRWRMKTRREMERVEGDKAEINRDGLKRKKRRPG